MHDYDGWASPPQTAARPLSGLCRARRLCIAYIVFSMLCCHRWCAQNGLSAASRYLEHHSMPIMSCHACIYRADYRLGEEARLHISSIVRAVEPPVLCTAADTVRLHTLAAGAGGMAAVGGGRPGQQHPLPHSCPALPGRAGRQSARLQLTSHTTTARAPCIDMQPLQLCC